MKIPDLTGDCKSVSSQKNNTGRPVEVFGKFSKNHLRKSRQPVLKTTSSRPKIKKTLTGREKRIPTGNIS